VESMNLAICGQCSLFHYESPFVSLEGALRLYQSQYFQVDVAVVDVEQLDAHQVQAKGNDGRDHIRLHMERIGVVCLHSYFAY